MLIRTAGSFRFEIGIFAERKSRISRQGKDKKKGKYCVRERERERKREN